MKICHAAMKYFLGESFMRAIMLVVCVAVCVSVSVVDVRCCSTFIMRGDSYLLVGHNLDETPGFRVPGLVCINKRGVRKEGVSWAELVAPPGKGDSIRAAAGAGPADPAIVWVSSFGSITVNTDGLEFPDWGVNEVGLVICEMSLPGTRFPSDESRATIFMSQWIQYQLDNHPSVADVIANATTMNLDGWNWHFMVADATGAGAVIEFIDGEAVVHAGETLPVPALCNASYAAELRRLRKHEAPGMMGAARRLFPWSPRFVRAARMLEDYDASSGTEPIDYAWEILEEIRIRGWNKWSILVDVAARRVYFNTRDNRGIRHVSMDGIDFSCETPAGILDINADLAGDVSGAFVDFTYERNLAFVRERAALLFVERLRPLTDNGLTVETYARRFAGIAGRTECPGAER